MPDVYVGIGSNINREANIRSGIAALETCFGDLRISRVFESEAVGFQGDNFYNLVAVFQTAATVRTVFEQLRAIEHAHGRDRNEPRFASKTLDLDLLLYGDLVLRDNRPELPREEIVCNAFVLWPLSELAPTLRHPMLGVTYEELWANFEQGRQNLWPVTFEFGTK